MTPTETSSVVDILLVEDNPADVRLVKEALVEADVPGRLQVVNTGDQALEYLRRAGMDADHPRPDLILLDLNLPGISGEHVLIELKADPKLRTIPVVVFTSSDRPVDVHLSYALHANSYIVKPTNVDEYVEQIRSLKHFWVNTARLPSSNGRRRGEEPG